MDAEDVAGGFDWRRHPALVGGNNFYVTGEENLSLVSLNAAAGVVLKLRGRFLNMSGIVTPFEFTDVPNTDRTAKTTLFRLGEGWILNASVVVSSGTPVFGQTFVKLHLVRGQLGATVVLATLIEGLVTATMQLAYPGSAQIATLQAPGAIRSITGTAPAAGAQISETVPAGAIWRLISIHSTYVASAALGTRQPQLTIDDGTNVFYQAAAGIAIAPSVTMQMGWINTGALGSIAGILSTGPLPTFPCMLPGFHFRSIVSGGDAADQFAAPQYVVEEWLSGS